MILDLQGLEKTVESVAFYYTKKNGKNFKINIITF